MASCLDDLIGDDNGCATRTGRLYLRDVGISEDFIKAILTKENASSATFMEDRRRLATEYVTNDLITHYDEFTTGRTFIDSDRIGKYPQTESLVSADSNYLHGMVVEVCTPASNTRILISKIEFYGETSGPVTVTIQDLRDGRTLETVTIDAVAGQVSTIETDIAISCGRERKRLLITTDQDVYYKSTVLGDGCARCKGNRYRNGVLEASQYMLPVGDKAIWNNLAPGPDAGGLSIVATVQCDPLGWLCEVKAALALPLLYCLGREIFTIALYNFDRYGIQNLRKQDVEKRRDEFEAHYAKAMNDLFKTALVPNDGICFVCRERTSSSIILP